MAILDDINRMKREGKSDLEITTQLRQNGIPDNAIADALAQSKIKDAVNFPANEENNAQMANQQNAMNAQMPQIPQQTQQQQFQQPPQTYGQNQSYQNQNTYDQQQYENNSYSGMQPSMLAPQAEQPVQQPAPQAYDQYQQYPAQQDPYASQEAYGGYDAYAQYQPYDQQVSSDIITEISEQVVAEKLSNVQDKLEKAIDFRTVAEAKLTNLSERLKRIEEIMDRLQISVLQKVGEYVSDVGDIKKEIRENQESFKALLPKLKEIHEEREHKARITHHKQTKKKKKHHP